MGWWRDRHARAEAFAAAVMVALVAVGAVFWVKFGALYGALIFGSVAFSLGLTWLVTRPQRNPARWAPLLDRYGLVLSHRLGGFGSGRATGSVGGWPVSVNATVDDHDGIAIPGLEVRLHVTGPRVPPGATRASLLDAMQRHRPAVEAAVGRAAGFASVAEMPLAVVSGLASQLNVHGGRQRFDVVLTLPGPSFEAASHAVALAVGLADAVAVAAPADRPHD